MSRIEYKFGHCASPETESKDNLYNKRIKKAYLGCSPSGARRQNLDNTLLDFFV